MSSSGYGFRIDNRDVNCTWLWVIDIDNKEEEIGIMEVNRKDVMGILETFFTNYPEKDDEIKGSLKELYEWVLDVILECGYDVDGGKIVEKE